MKNSNNYPLCKDCRHFSLSNTPTDGMCDRTVGRTRSLVTGETEIKGVRETCSSERKPLSPILRLFRSFSLFGLDRCGEEGRYFEAEEHGLPDNNE